MSQEFIRHVETDGNGYDRYYDPVAGAAVVYENRGQRRSFGYVNGGYFSVDWPDTASIYAGDSGQALTYRLRPEYENGRVVGWYLYTYMYSGDHNRSEWREQIA